MRPAEEVPTALLTAVALIEMEQRGECNLATMVDEGQDTSGLIGALIGLFVGMAEQNPGGARLVLHSAREFALSLVV
jgi:hypothetical protein